jgi:hypothetical protein
MDEGYASTITLDTLKLAQRLEAAGFPPTGRRHRAGLSESLREVSTLATKSDVQ